MITFYYPFYILCALYAISRSTLFPSFGGLWYYIPFNLGQFHTPCKRCNCILYFSFSYELIETTRDFYFW